MKYVRELLKVSVELYNASEVIEKDFEKRMLLVSYLYLIDLQVQLGESKLAKKSFKKHFELFNLNSTNPNDVLLALKEERKKFVKQQTIWILAQISKKIQCGVRRGDDQCFAWKGLFLPQSFILADGSNPT